MTDHRIEDAVARVRQTREYQAGKAFDVPASGVDEFVDAIVTATLAGVTPSVTRPQVVEHVPVKTGSSSSMAPGGYSGDWIICSCDPKDYFRDGVHHAAARIPIAEYPAHLLGGLGIEVRDVL